MKAYELLTIAFILFTLGSVLQHIVVIKNDCSMPVNTEKNLYSSQHKSYKDYDTIKLKFFTDIFNIYELVYFSINDILMITALILFYYSSRKYKIERRLKQNEKAKNNR